MENWNKLCYYLSEKIQTDIPESEFELIVEKGLEILGWDEFSGDFDIRPNYPLWSTRKSLRPDFLIKSNETGEKLFVVEIKRPKVPLSNQNQIQLSTYMRQFKLKFGILIGPQIQVFYDGELNKKENATLIENIEFKRDNEKGQQLTELFSKDKFDKDALSNFAKKSFKKLNEKETKKEIKRKILSEEFKEIVSEIIVEKLSVEYDINLVSKILSNINLEILDQYSRTSNGKFEIVLNPANEVLFKEKLLETKSATIKYFYENGEIVDKHWDAPRFTRESSLRGKYNFKIGNKEKRENCTRSNKSRINNKRIVKPDCQHCIKIIASKSLFTKVLADFLSVIYLLNLVLKIRKKSYTNTLATITSASTTALRLLSSVSDTQTKVFA